MQGYTESCTTESIPPDFNGKPSAEEYELIAEYPEYPEYPTPDAAHARRGGVCTAGGVKAPFVQSTPSSPRPGTAASAAQVSVNCASVLPKRASSTGVRQPS